MFIYTHNLNGDKWKKISPYLGVFRLGTLATLLTETAGLELGESTWPVAISEALFILFFRVKNRSGNIKSEMWVDKVF